LTLKKKHLVSSTQTKALNGEFVQEVLMYSCGNKMQNHIDIAYG
jgi:hypothetical protein